MTTMKALGFRTTACAAALAGLAGCQTGSAFRDPMERLNPDMQAVIIQYQALGAKPVSTLTVAQARSQPTIADAVKAVVQARTNRPFSESVLVKTTDMTVPGAAGPLPARLYDPAPGHRDAPIILYFHGGGLVVGNLNTDDAAARALASQAHAMVLSVAYRLAPEARFPAALDDGIASYRWLLDNAASLGADPRRIAVAGMSAGGTLALDTAVAARDGGLKLPVHELLIDPVAGSDLETRSAIANKHAVPLNRADVRWYFENAVASPADVNDKRIDLVGHADLHGLPPTTIISAEMDPLESGGTALTQKLQAAGVDVRRIEYQGTTHNFFGTGAVVARAQEAETFAASELNATFETIGAPPPPPRAKPARASLRHRPAHRAR